MKPNRFYKEKASFQKETTNKWDHRDFDRVLKEDLEKYKRNKPQKSFYNAESEGKWAHVKGFILFLLL